ncbi:hypothetical protein SAMN04487934_101310 [Eubacterium ruminantium]|nr:hypothetical protein SAMN04487934_101310 [Eubacterium ruminantium]
MCADNNFYHILALLLLSSPLGWLFSGVQTTISVIFSLFCCFPPSRVAVFRRTDNNFYHILALLLLSTPLEWLFLGVQATISIIFLLFCCFPPSRVAVFRDISNMVIIHRPLRGLSHVARSSYTYVFDTCVVKETMGFSEQARMPIVSFTAHASHAHDELRGRA